MAILEHDVPAPLVINLDETPLSYVSPSKYTFSFKGTQNVPIKGVDDKRQMTATSVVSLTGKFLPIQLIYKGKTERSLPKFKFPSTFSLSYAENNWPNNEIFSSKLSFDISRWLKGKMESQKNSTLL